MAALVEDAVTREAARWFMRMAHVPVDHPDRGRFEAWLVASPRHAQEYARFSDLWVDFDTAPRLERLAQALEERRNAEVWQKNGRGRQRRGILGGLGALGLGAIVGWRFLDGSDDTPSMSMARATGRRQQLDQPLPDGSRLILAPESALSVRYFKTHREVDLQRGEALFEVARDVQRPFIVTCSRACVTVLGTRFVVNQLPGDAVRVSVLEGRVRLARQAVGEVSRGEADASAGLVLSAEEVAELAGDGAPRRLSRRADDAQAWRQGRLVFDGDTLAEVVQRLSRFTAQPLSLALSPPLTGRAEARITAVVQLRDVDAFVRNLPRLAPVRLRESGCPQETEITVR